MRRILFSCVGSTDPVRGLRDGSMLHIMRHYRPDKVVLYLSAEIREKDAKDHRFQRAFDDFEQRVPDYRPEIVRIESDIRDVSDFDCFYDEFGKYIRELQTAEPDAEILLNLSSGSVQMKMTLALLSADLRFRTRGIQVKTPEKAASKAQRTTDKGYDLEAEIELNEDFETDAPNRCEEPRLFMVQRETEKNQIRALLDAYNYEAISMMKPLLPSESMTLIHFLQMRAEYRYAEAEETAKLLGRTLPFKLYPIGKDLHASKRIRKEYREVSEYLLCLKLLQKNGKLTDLVIRLNPLILRLQKAYLKSCCDFDCEEIIDHSNGHEYICPQKICAYSAELAQHLSDAERRDINLSFCMRLIAYFGKNETEEGKLFHKLSKLNQKHRNTSAHTLNNITEEDIKESMGISSKILIEKLEKLLKTIYGDLCAPKLFDIYDTCNAYIYQMI